MYFNFEMNAGSAQRTYGFFIASATSGNHRKSVMVLDAERGEAAGGGALGAIDLGEYSTSMSSAIYMPDISLDCSLTAFSTTTSPYIHTYDNSDGSKRSNPATLPPSGGRDCKFSPDGTKLAVLYNNGIIIYNSSDMTVFLAATAITATSASTLTWHPDGLKVLVHSGTSPYKLLEILASDGTVDEVAASTIAPNSAVPPHYSADGSLLMVLNSTAYHLYDTSDWSRLYLASDTLSNARSLSFSPDGTRLYITQSSAPRGKLYDLSDRSLLTISGTLPSATVNFCAFTHDNKYLFAFAASGTDGYVLDVETTDVVYTGSCLNQQTYVRGREFTAPIA